MPQPDLEKKTALTLGQKKARGEKITAVTAYDYPTTRLASQEGIDLILVGDSLGMVLQKYISDVQNRDFPNEKESYHLNQDIEEFLK